MREEVEILNSSVFVRKSVETLSDGACLHTDVSTVEAAIIQTESQMAPSDLYRLGFFWGALLFPNVVI